MLGNNCVFQQDDGLPYTRNHIQEWYKKHLSTLVPKDRWSVDLPDLNPCNYFLWDKLTNAMN